MDRREVARIKSEVARERQEARHELISGPNKLRSLVQRIHAQARLTDSGLSARHNRREQAREDLRFLGIPEQSVVVQTSTSGVSRPTTQPSRRIPRPTTTTRPTTASSTPSCPRCGSGMVWRLARRGRYAGKHFWGCSRYPKCRGIRNV